MTGRHTGKAVQWSADRGRRQGPLTPCTPALLTPAGAASPLKGQRLLFVWNLHTCPAFSAYW